MANKELSDLPEATSAGSLDIFHVKDSLNVDKKITLDNLSRTMSYAVQPELTVATMVANPKYTTASVGKTVVETKEFSTGNGGGGVYDVVLTSSVTPNGQDIIQGVADTAISFVLRTGDVVYLRQLGALKDGSADTQAILLRAASMGVGIIKGVPGDVYRLDSNVTFPNPGVILDLNGSEIKQHTTWTGTELITINHELSGVISTGPVGIINGNQVATDATQGIQGDFTALTPDSQAIFDNLLLKNMGDSGLKINTGKKDKVTRIWCTNNHISSGTSQSGNVRFDSCEELQSENIVIWESFGKGVAWSVCNRCTHSGLIVDRATFNTEGEGGITTNFVNDISIINVYCRNVNSKLSQFSSNVKITNFDFINTGNRAFQLQGASECKISNGTIVGSAASSISLVLNQHPDLGSGISNSTNNTFTDVKVTASSEIPLSLDANTSGNKFLNCTFLETAADVTGSVTDYVVVDSGTGNSFKECNVEVSTTAGYGGFLHTGASWSHTDCVINVPSEVINNSAAGTVKNGVYTSTGGGSNGWTAGAAVDVDGCTVLVDGSTAAVPALRLNAPGSRLRHSSFKTVTDTVAGYGILFGGTNVEDTQILFCETAGGNRSIKSIIQSTTNKLVFITTEGGGTDNGGNGDTNPGAPTQSNIVAL